jgi:GT2 family glycosyltransferase
MRLSVIILAHDQLDLTRRCLRALAVALDGTDHEVLCIDNASTVSLDPLLDEGAGFRHFRLDRNDENLTFSTANDRAAATASGEWLLFLNNDVDVAPGSVRAFLDFTSQHPAAEVCGARLRYPDGPLQHAGIEQMLWGLASNYGVGASATDERFLRNQERFAVTGAMLFVRRALFESVGGFDPDYAWGYEDVDFCLKARAAGAEVWYVAGAEGTHAESATLRHHRRTEDTNRNYATYRQRWAGMLEPRERAYLRWLADSGIRRVTIFGTGSAGRALCATLQADGIEVVAFTETVPGQHVLCGLPVVAPTELATLAYDCLVVGTQRFFEVEPMLRTLDPARGPLFPVLPFPRPSGTRSER